MEESSFLMLLGEVSFLIVAQEGLRCDYHSAINTLINCLYIRLLEEPIPTPALPLKGRVKSKLLPLQGGEGEGDGSDRDVNII